MSSKQERRVKYWVLYLCSIHDKYEGLSMYDLYNRRPQDFEEVGHGLIDKILKELVGDGLIVSLERAGWGTLFYKISKKGRIELNKLGSTGSEFYKVLSLLPPEHDLRYRIYNIENLIFYAFLTFAFFSLGKFFSSNGYPLVALVLLGLMSSSAIISSFFLLNILLYSVNEISVRISEGVYKFISRRARIISTTVLLVLIAGALFLIYQYSVVSFWVTLGTLVIGVVFSNHRDNFLKFRDKIEEWLDRAKEYFNDK